MFAQCFFKAGPRANPSTQRRGILSGSTGLFKLLQNASWLILRFLAATGIFQFPVQ